MSEESEDWTLQQALAARHEVRTLTLNEEEERIENKEKEIVKQLTLLDDVHSKLKIKRAKLQDAKAKQRADIRRQKQKIAGSSQALSALEQELVAKVMTNTKATKGGLSTA